MLELHNDRAVQRIEAKFATGLTLLNYKRTIYI